MQHSALKLIDIVVSEFLAAKLVIFVKVSIQPDDLIGSKLKIYATHCIDDICERLEVDQNISADGNVKILLDRLHQKLGTAP